MARDCRGVHPGLWRGLQQAGHGWHGPPLSRCPSQRLGIGLGRVHGGRSIGRRAAACQISRVQPRRSVLGTGAAEATMGPVDM